jgi:hypothetical protein
MNIKMICLLGVMVLVLGCAQDFPSMQSTPYPPYTYNPMVTHVPPGSNPNQPFDPFEVEQSALPPLRDLPQPAALKRSGPPRKYTGIIKNKTRYEVSVPSNNSGATLTIPARGWIEYISYTPHFDLTAYREGKPFYCMNINADPRTYDFMCDKYDFMVEIVKPEPKSKPILKKKRLKRRAKCDEGVQGLG